MIGEKNWRSDVPAAGTATLLLERLDAIAELIDGGRLVEAREKLYGRRWLADVGLAGVPVEVLKGAQQWVDTAHDALASYEPDTMLAIDSLLQARRVING